MGTFARFSPASGSGNDSLSDATTGTGRAIAFHNCRQVSWGVTYTVGSEPTTGTIVIEQAFSADYASVWGQVAEIDCASVVLGTDGWGTYPGMVGFLRARFTVDADHGVTVSLNGLED